MKLLIFCFEIEQPSDIQLN